MRTLTVDEIQTALQEATRLRAKAMVELDPDPKVREVIKALDGVHDDVYPYTELYVDKRGGVWSQEIKSESDYELARMEVSFPFWVIKKDGTELDQNFGTGVFEESLRGALEERFRFYNEREEQYGEQAWPR